MNFHHDQTGHPDWKWIIGSVVAFKSISQTASGKHCSQSVVLYEFESGVAVMEVFWVTGDSGACGIGGSWFNWLAVFGWLLGAIS
jgi:hypothetical protein